MLIPFPEDPHVLTPEEQELVPVFVMALGAKHGKDAAVKNKAIREGLKKHYGLVVSDGRVRKIIEHIRMQGLVRNLIAGNCGYYVSTDQEEIRVYAKSLRHRAQAINKLADTYE